MEDCEMKCTQGCLWSRAGLVLRKGAAQKELECVYDEGVD